MKSYFYAVFMIFTFPGVVYALEKEDLVGIWSVMSEYNDEGTSLKVREIYVFKEDGTYKSEGPMVMSLEGGIEVSMSGVSSGTWSFKGEELITTTPKSEIEFFISNSSELNLKAFEQLMLDDPDEITTSILQKEAAKELVFKGKEETYTSRFKRMNKYDVSDSARFRRTSSFLLDDGGFKFAGHLPLIKEVELQSHEEVLKHIAGMYAAILWVTFTEEQASSKNIEALVKHYGRAETISKEVGEILSTDRVKAREKYMDKIGWVMENLYTLTWAVGFEEPPYIYDQMIDNNISLPMLAHLKPLWQGKEIATERLKLRKVSQIRQLQDIFYCTHNAARSAQTGVQDVVPQWFHPIVHGGIIHEKRHALFWLLSKGVKWDDTDLST